MKKLLFNLIEIQYFKSVRFVGDWELNILTKNNLSFRVGTSQIAMWINYYPIFNKVKNGIGKFEECGVGGISLLTFLFSPYKYNIKLVTD